MKAPLLLDLGPLSECCTDAALEALHKAAADPPGEDPNIWRPHESTLIRDLVERYTAAGAERIAALQADLHAWLSGSRHVPGAQPPKPSIPLYYPWPAEYVAEVEAYLAVKPPALWAAEDWQALIDALVQKHIPTAVLAQQAEHYVVQSYAMGSVQVAHGEISADKASAIATTMPTTVAGLVDLAALPHWQQSVIEYARTRAVANVVSLTDANRAKLRQVVLDHQERVFLGDRTASTAELQQKLFDTFGDWNRDWRRIAVSEAGENLDQGVVGSVAAGTLLKRVEMYHGACAYCRKVDGRIMKVVAPDAEEKNAESEVWVGKTNLGRSSSPRKRVGGMLVDRLPAERWWLAAGIIHPHCRGRWVVLPPTIAHAS